MKGSGAQDRLNVAPIMAGIRPDSLVIAASITMLVMAALCISWEIWLAPLRPGAWLLSLKSIPLLLALPGFWRGHLRTYQWWSMLILFYLAEGLVRGASDPGFSAVLGWIEAAISVVIFILILLVCRRALKQRAQSL